MELVEMRGERGPWSYTPIRLKNQSPQFLKPPATPQGLAQAKVITLITPIRMPPVMTGQLSKKTVLYPFLRMPVSTLLSFWSFIASLPLSLMN
jgi:hypothetical protein